jgi:hypothetical protein
MKWRVKHEHIKDGNAQVHLATVEADSHDDAIALFWESEPSSTAVVIKEVTCELGTESSEEIRETL